MINLYAYTYPSAASKFDGYILTKIGDSTRDVDVRVDEQGGAAEYESKQRIGEWNNCKNIRRDFEVHRILRRRGLHHREGAGNEWFKIPGETTEEVYAYIDDVIEELEGNRVRGQVTLRSLQQQKLNEVMNTVLSSDDKPIEIVANLCPRFGKTIWALMLFNELTKHRDTNVMLLPAYWLSVHSSFVNELSLFSDFSDIVSVETEEEYQSSIESGHRVLIPVSLHGDVDTWKEKHQWISNIDRSRMFVFADEGDFGTHAENQVGKLKHISDGASVRVYASGTNVQRLAKTASKVDAVLYSAYSELESTEPNMVRRKFYTTDLVQLKSAVESEDVTIQPSWTKLWSKPNANKQFITQLFRSFVGDESLIPSLNLNQITQDDIGCFMVLVSANNKQMSQLARIVRKSCVNHEVVVLNGDYTTNKKAEELTDIALSTANQENKEGVIILANQMGSRSYSISEIQATVMAYDRGSVDASQQKVSRCLTPGKTFNDESKEFGHIVEVSFDPNRSENIERLLIDEIIQVQKSQDTDFPQATSFVLNSIDLSRVNEYGHLVEITEEQMFDTINNNENLLRVADVSIDIERIFEYNLLEVLEDVNSSSSSNGSDKLVVGEDVINRIRQGQQKNSKKKDPVLKSIENMINDAVRAINMSATSIYNLVETGDTYRECLELMGTIESDEFETIVGISPKSVLRLLDNNVLNENLLDVIVKNSQTVEDIWA